MGLFSRQTQPNQEPSIQRQKRLFDQAMATDSEVRFARAFLSVATQLMDESSVAMCQTGTVEACVLAYVLGGILDEAGGAGESAQARELKSALLRTLSQDMFVQFVQVVKREVLSRISETVATHLDGKESMPVISADDSSYMTVVRRGCAKAKALYEAAQQG